MGATPTQAKQQQHTLRNFILEELQEHTPYKELASGGIWITIRNNNSPARIKSVSPFDKAIKSNLSPKGKVGTIEVPVWSPDRYTADFPYQNKHRARYTKYGYFDFDVPKEWPIDKRKRAIEKIVELFDAANIRFIAVVSPNYGLHVICPLKERFLAGQYDKDDPIGYYTGHMTYKAAALQFLVDILPSKYMELFDMNSLEPTRTIGVPGTVRYDKGGKVWDLDYVSTLERFGYHDLDLSYYAKLSVIPPCKDKETRDKLLEINECPLCDEDYALRGRDKWDYMKAKAQGLAIPYEVLKKAEEGRNTSEEMKRKQAENLARRVEERYRLWDLAENEVETYRRRIINKLYKKGASKRKIKAANARINRLKDYLVLATVMMLWFVKDKEGAKEASNNFYTCSHSLIDKVSAMAGLQIPSKGDKKYVRGFVRDTLGFYISAPQAPNRSQFWGLPLRKVKKLLEKINHALDRTDPTPISTNTTPMEGDFTRGSSPSRGDSSWYIDPNNGSSIFSPSKGGDSIDPSKTDTSTQKCQFSAPGGDKDPPSQSQTDDLEYIQQWLAFPVVSWDSRALKIKASLEEEGIWEQVKGG